MIKSVQKLHKQFSGLDWLESNFIVNLVRSAMVVFFLTTTGCAVEKEVSRGKFSVEQNGTLVSSPPPSDDQEITDVPIWINGSYLTCDWFAIESESEASIKCWVSGENGDEVELDETVETKWQVVGSQSDVDVIQEKPATETWEVGSEEASPIDGIFILEAVDIVSSTVRTQIVWEGVSKVYQVELKTVLPGLSSRKDQSRHSESEIVTEKIGSEIEPDSEPEISMDLATCFAAGNSVLECFLAAGINTIVHTQ